MYLNHDLYLLIIDVPLCMTYYGIFNLYLYFNINFLYVLGLYLYSC